MRLLSCKLEAILRANYMPKSYKTKIKQQELADFIYPGDLQGWNWGYNHPAEP
jgi:hypothetical protein